MAVDPEAIFLGVCFWLSNTLRVPTRDALYELLVASGATPCPSQDGTKSTTAADQPATLSHVATEKLTHIVTDNWHFSARDKLSEQVEVVSPHWVTRSYDLQHRQEPRFYSPDPAKLLSGFCIATTEIPPKDAEWVWNIVALLGGQFRQVLTKEVTHLLAGKEAGSKWQMASTHGKALGMHILLPQWLYDTFQSRTLQPPRVYAWPNPLLYAVANGTVSTSAAANANPTEPREQPQSKTHQILGGFEPRLAMYDALPSDDPTLVKMVTLSNTASMSSGNEVANLLPDALRFADNAAQNGLGGLPQPPPPEPAFAQNLKFYVASDTQMSYSVAQAVAQRLRAAGAADVFIASAHHRPTSVKTLKTADEEIKGAYELEWEDQLSSSDYVICKERSGWEYWLAAKEDKPIGTLLWLLHTIVSGKVDSPLHNIFHYPHPPSPIEGFDQCQMTITNYTSTKREMLKRLVELMGGTVTGEMNRRTKYVVAARREGKKVESAIRWEVPVLNHKWLSECCIRWTLVDPTNFEPGRSFLPGVDYQNTMLSDLPQSAVDAWAGSSKALRIKEQAAQFLEFARAQAKQQPSEQSHKVPPTLELDESESDHGEPIASGASRHVRPSNSTPALIEDQLLPQSKKSPQKSVLHQSSPNVLSNGGASAKTTPSASGLAKGKDKGKTKSSRPSAHALYEVEDDDDDDDDTMDGIVAATATAPSSTSSKRQAALAGADKNRANALDMNQHEKEKKRKRLSEILPADSDSDAGAPKKRKPKARHSDSEDDDTPDILPKASTSKPQMSRKSAGRPAESTPRKGPASSGSGKVRFLQTGHHMPEDLIAGFEALGAKKVDDPLTCTHVISEEIKRTVKFLSALSHGPPFLTEKWVKDSVKRGKILPIDNYKLSDPKGEAKWDMNLAESIRRARQGRKVFDECTFYFTPHTTPDKNLLKEIIQANGGTTSDAKPTRANMLPASRQKCLVSSSQDEKIWRPFVKADSSMAVHEGENVLLSVLRQDFNRTDY